MNISNRVVLTLSENNIDEHVIIKATVLDTNRVVYITADNIYDLFEGSKGSVDVLFVKENTDYPAVQVSKKVTQSRIEMSALYHADESTSIRIVDTSGTGLFKWLIRAILSEKGQSELFTLNMGNSYYSSITGYNALRKEV